MSRARPIQIPGASIVWFDMNQNGRRASDEQIELLVELENKDLDDILDENLTQGELIKRLREALHGNPVPQEVIDQARKRKAERQTQPQCRICGKEGDSTRHHFVNKWILRELSNYTSKWSNRLLNCIPVCMGCHRKLHDRSNEDDKSIVSFLKDKEKEFVQRAISALLHERPTLFELLVHGDPNVYEARLVKDWCQGYFIIPDSEEVDLQEAA